MKENLICFILEENIEIAVVHCFVNSKISKNASISCRLSVQLRLSILKPSTVNLIEIVFIMSISPHLTLTNYK